jgi:hypothetical protein
MVGTLRFAHPTDAVGVAYLHKDCYPQPANLTVRWQIFGIFSAKSWQPPFPGTARRHASAAKKYLLCRKKNCAESAASSLPQDSHIELMFGAAGFGEPALSASRFWRFHIVSRGSHSPQCLGMLCKCFNQRIKPDGSPRYAP